MTVETVYLLTAGRSEKFCTSMENRVDFVLTKFKYA